MSIRHFGDGFDLTLRVKWVCKGCGGRFGALWDLTSDFLDDGGRDTLVPHVMAHVFPCSKVWPWCLAGQVGGIGAAQNVRAVLQDEYGHVDSEDLV